MPVACERAQVLEDLGQGKLAELAPEPPGHDERLDLLDEGCCHLCVQWERGND